MTENPTFAERILLVHDGLSDASVGHAFGGAVALAYYVEEPRATRDIDLNISLDVGHARTVLAALPAGVVIPKDAHALVEREGQIRLWWDGPGGVPVDLFFPQHEFHRVVAEDTREVPFLDRSIPIISATHLTVFKCLFNRARDWPDIDAMIRAGAVNTADAQAWVERLLGPGSDNAIHLSQVAAAAGLAPGGYARTDAGLPNIDWRELGA